MCENKYMYKAYQEALKAYKIREIPVGCVIVKNEKIVAKAHNNRQKKYNVLGHAEINAIRKAERKIKDWRLDGLEMYVTLKPCKLCQSVIKESRISKIVYLLDQDVNTNCSKFVQTNDCDELKKDYQILLKNFFNNLRH